MSLNRKELVQSLNEEIENLTRLRDWLAGGHSAASSAPAAAAPRGRRGRRAGSRLSASGRKKISEMMKKRWAERRKLAAKGK